MHEEMEIKYRGPLSPEQRHTLEAYLQAKGRLLSAGVEKVLFFETAMFPLVGDFQTGFARISLK